MFVPRLFITGNLHLKKTLSYLGITRIFEEHGDLTRISRHRSLKVGEVSLPGPTLPPPAQGAFIQPRARATVTAAIRAKSSPSSQAGLESSSASNQPYDPEQIT